MFLSCSMISKYFITKTKWKRLFTSMNYQRVPHFQAKQHEMLHTREKPYACTVCEKKIRQENTLKRHEKNILLVAFVIKSLWNIQSLYPCTMTRDRKVIKLNYTTFLMYWCCYICSFKAKTEGFDNLLFYTKTEAFLNHSFFEKASVFV